MKELNKVVRDLKMEVEGGEMARRRETKGGREKEGKGDRRVSCPTDP